MKELAEARFGQQFLSRTIGDDVAVAHEDDALNLRQNIAQMVSDHHQPRASASEPAECFAQLALSGEVERVGRLVEQQLLRAVDEGARNEDTALLSGRHCAHELPGEMRRLHSR